MLDRPIHVMPCLAIAEPRDAGTTCAAVSELRIVETCGDVVIAARRERRTAAAVAAQASNHEVRCRCG